VIQAFEDLGKLDNTLIIYINGDNGTSAEGGPLGTPNEVAFFNGVQRARRRADEVLRRVGHRADVQPHVGRLVVGLRHAVRWFKQNASQLGGINQNMVVSWPARIKDKGGLREQFVHVIDVVPTILEAAGIRAPEDCRRHQAEADRGHKLRLHLRREERQGTVSAQDAVLRMFGQWALYHEGWFLSTKVNRAPWEAFGAANPDPLNNQVLELFDLNKDFTQSENVAAKNPEKVKAMKRMFIAEAKKYQVFPLDASVAARIIAPARTSPPGARSSSTRGRWSGCRRATRRCC
jgi:arylsulfatase